MTNVEERLVFSLHDLYMILVGMNKNLINLQRKKKLFIYYQFSNIFWGWNHTPQRWEVSVLPVQHHDPKHKINILKIFNEAR